jgi:hypothetical protein
MRLLLVLRQPPQVKLHLPGMLRAEFLQFEIHGHKPPQFAVVEQKIDIKIFIVRSDPLLPCNEGEPIAEFVGLVEGGSFQGFAIKCYFAALAA